MSVAGLAAQLGPQLQRQPYAVGFSKRQSDNEEQLRQHCVASTASAIANSRPSSALYGQYHRGLEGRMSEREL